jgi:hypothetical protein
MIWSICEGDTLQGTWYAFGEGVVLVAEHEVLRLIVSNVKQCESLCMMQFSLA